MRQTYGLIAGASAVALAGVLSVQTGLFGGNEAPADRVATLSPEEPLPPAAQDAAALRERIGTLETTLAEREAAPVSYTHLTLPTN